MDITTTPDNTPKILNVIAVTTYTRRDQPRLNCLQAPLLWNGQKAYTQHKKEMLCFFQLIFMCVVVPRIESAKEFYGKDKIAHEQAGKELYLLLGFLELLNDMLVARHIEKLRIKTVRSGWPKTLWPCICGGQEIPTEFGRLFFQNMYPLLKYGWQNPFADAARPFWEAFHNVQAPRTNRKVPNALYKRLVDEHGTSLAEECVKDNTVPQMQQRLCNISNLAAVTRTEQTLESPFNYRGKTIYSVDYEFFDTDGDEIDPYDGKKKPKIVRFDYDDNMDLFGNPDLH